MADVSDTPEVVAAKRAALLEVAERAEMLGPTSGVAWLREQADRLYPAPEPPLVWTTPTPEYEEQWARLSGGKWVCKTDGEVIESLWLSDALVAEMAAQLPPPVVTGAMALDALKGLYADLPSGIWLRGGVIAKMRAALKAVAPLLTRTVVVRPEGGQRVWAYKGAQPPVWHAEERWGELAAPGAVLTGTVYPDAEGAGNG